MDLSIPDHVEVTIRLCLSFILTYIITLGSFPLVIPQSQVVIIASVASAFTMILPTLLFSIGSAISGMVTNVLVALIVATLLLAVAATGGVNAYIGAYFIVALVLSGLRFTKEGSSSALLLMFVSLNTMGLSTVAEEKGIGFVASLWTESGVQNPNAVFRNTLIGMCWVTLCIIFARVIPPSRTLRFAFSRKLLPKVLKDVASFIRVTVAHHIRDDIDDVEDSDDDDLQEVIHSTTSESPLLRLSARRSDDINEKPKSMNDACIKIVQDASITLVPGLVELTALEPRIRRIFCECGSPQNLVTLLLDLTNAVNDLVFSSLTLRAFSKAGFQEIQIDGLGEKYEETAVTLDRCAGALATLNQSNVVAEASGEDPGNSNSAFDPIRLNFRAMRVEECTNNYIDAMVPIDRTHSYFDKSARTVYVRFLCPWIMGAGFGLILAIFGCFVKAFTPMTWKRIFRAPYYDLPKFVWCLKFAVGFMALVSMHVYWPAFANLELSTKDEATGARFSGWYLIAYAFSTTQTVEGTWKKSILRIVGTVFGGFSAWLALTASQDSPVGLGIWMTITSTTVAYFGLPEGLSSRFGLDKDAAWGPAYFSMTQALVTLEVYWGYGGKNDITLNRIVSNLVGIAMSMAMALIPPGVYGNSPRESKFLLEDQKRALRDCIGLVLEGSDSAKFHHLYATAKATFVAGFSEANENYNDANKLQRLCILKPNPRMKLELNNAAVLGSSILSLIRFGIILVEAEPEDEGSFAEGSEERRALETILEGLDIVDDPHKISRYHMHHQAGEGKSHERPNILCDSLNQAQRAVPAHTTFVHLCVYLCHYISHRELKLDNIYWGFLGKRHTSKGRRTTLPKPVIQLDEQEDQVID
mmetsp:Transcript_17431/g.37647  ORF Transcript_17431/g.37647 Transcript_17431/m.37647 type:complete len:869 (-) Transcript_17431:198-2804(-)|eukprot:CAMPEP_0172308782 /NCGR_PEP_ID=MMETSP1058-20130122/9276_1 /TAXON_ID=83371 /ORGANISM="Detonula confervacea, Strain CCMP 353" /LENGTH=868 /DNA_ID=CAMNT_0013021279 /DNA_START=110 /DNA_END=2716 /DNA_ORIENTATION=-